jgi:Vitamin K-dependent gamma-carboxylase
MRFWFAPASPTNLAVSRLLFFSGVLIMYAHDDFSAWGEVSPAYWLPIPLFDALHLRPLDSALIRTLESIWRVSLATSAAGLASRVSMAVTAVLGAYLLGLPHNFGQTYHFDALLVIAMGVFALSRAGDALSIDAWVRGGRRAASGEYTWPLRTIWVAMSLVFFAAGLAKLRYGGLEWITSDNMSILLTRALYHVSDADPQTTWGLVIARHQWASSAIAAAAVAIELSFPLALVNRTARAVLVPAAFAMLVGIRALMGPTFGGFLVANVVWVPWDALGARVIAWRRSGRVARTTHDVVTDERPSRETYGVPLS